MIQEWLLFPEKFESSPPPKPGSKEAAALGCTCDPVVNQYGYGVSTFKGLFQYTAGCPVHVFKGGMW